VKKLRIEITRRRNRDGLENLTDIAAVVPTMRDDMKQDFFSGHAPSITVGEPEVQRLREVGLHKRSNVLDVPSIRGLYVASQLSKRWSFLGVRGVEWGWFPGEAGAKEPVNDVDVVEGANARVKLLGVLRRQGAQQCEELGIGPGLVGEQGLQSGD
jgi:hypothetical protein